MPREDRDTGQEGPAVSHRGAGHGDLQSEIDKLCTALLAIDASLAPIVGARGVTALYQRSLHLTAATHGLLAGVQQDDPHSLDLEPLRQALAGQPHADVVALGNALLQTFQQLLTSLIGPSLTERLLRSVWTDSSSGSTAQDTTP